MNGGRTGEVFAGGSKSGVFRLIWKDGVKYYRKKIKI